MSTCPFCDNTFDEEHDLHLHMGEEHGDALNGHQQEQVKKARRTQERETVQAAEQLVARRKRYGKLLAGLLVLGLVGVLGFQLVDVSATPDTESGAFNLSGQPVLGVDNAPVTVVEFGDYRCPFCARFDTQVFPQLKQDYIDTGRVRFAFINFPFLGPGSTQAAVGGECVLEQSPEAFWEYHHGVYENQGPESQRWVDTDLLVQLGAEHNAVNATRLRACIETRATQSAVSADLALGQARGVSGTPTVFVNGEQLQAWNYATIEAAIEAALP